MQVSGPWSVVKTIPGVRTDADDAREPTFGRTPINCSIMPPTSANRSSAACSEPSRRVSTTKMAAPAGGATTFCGVPLCRIRAH